MGIADTSQFKDVPDIKDVLAERKEENVFKGVKDSGKREEFTTGSVRDTRDGKGRFDLIPAYPMKRLAVHYEHGSKKYGDWNWSRGQNLSRYIDSALRHLNNYQAGDREEDHMIAAAWNIFAFVHTEEMIRRGKLPKELNDIHVD